MSSTEIDSGAVRALQGETAASEQIVRKEIWKVLVAILPSSQGTETSSRPNQSPGIKL